MHYNDEVIPVVHTNHRVSLCTRHSLQNKCTCDFFGHPLGLNLWLWYSGPPSLPICYAKQLWMMKWCEIMMVLPGRGVFEAKKVTSESDWALIHCDRCFADERIEKKKNETKRNCLNPLFFPFSWRLSFFMFYTNTPFTMTQSVQYSCFEVCKLWRDIACRLKVTLSNNASAKDQWHNQSVKVVIDIKQT